MSLSQMFEDFDECYCCYRSSSGISGPVFLTTVCLSWKGTKLDEEFLALALHFVLQCEGVCLNDDDNDSTRK